MRIKKYLVMLLSLIVMCGLFGCGKKNENLSDEYIFLPRTELHTLRNTTGFEREYKYSYKYDPHGNITTKKYYEKGGLFFKLGSRFDTTYTYDENGNKTKEQTRAEYFSIIITDTHSVSEYSYEFLYNQNGQLVKKEYASGADTEPCAYKYEYDEHGNLTKEIECFSDGEEKITTEYVYDSNNQMIKKTEWEYSETYNLTYISKQTEYTYDGGKLTYSKTSSFYITAPYYVTEEQHYTEDNYYYDKLGRLVKKEAASFDKDGSKTREETWEYKNFVRIAL